MLINLFQYILYIEGFFLKGQSAQTPQQLPSAFKPKLLLTLTRLTGSRALLTSLRTTSPVYPLPETHLTGYPLTHSL